MTLTFWAMTIGPLVGHRDLRQRLAAAIDGDRLPQVLLFVGPEGVGKQRLALWTVQRMFCQDSSSVEPCGSCGPCRRVLGLAHPDLHWIVPIPRPKAGDPDKQVEEAAEALGEVMAERRRQPLWGSPDGMSAHGIATARLVSRRAALTPGEASRKVFVIGHAERLVPQESSPEAANALLKLLEEPPRDTVMILTTTDLHRVLPTIRSRATSLRVNPIPDEEVAAFLREHLDPLPAPSVLEERVQRAEGAIGIAVAESGPARKAHDAAVDLLEAVAKGEGTRLEACLSQPPFQARGEFTAILDALASTLGDAARESTGERPRREVPKALRRMRDPGRLAEAIIKVQETREMAQGNMNPQLLLAALTRDLRDVV